MTITSFNPMNPMTYWTLPFGGAVRTPSVFPAQPKATGPIAIDASASDPGIKLTTAADSITFTGTTRGDKRPIDAFGMPASYTVARGMSFSLDIDKAPTTDISGKTDYSKKNARLFTLTTSPGWSAVECAERLADKVNANREFKADVVEHRDGTATLQFSRR